RPHDRDEIIVTDLEGDVVESGKVTALQMVYLRHVRELDQGNCFHGTAPSLFPEFCNDPFPLHPEDNGDDEDDPASDDGIECTEATATAATEAEESAAATSRSATAIL